MSNNAVEVVRTLTETVHPFPFSSEFEVMSSKLMWSDWSVVLPALWVTLWLLPLATIQSYRLFRSEVREGIRPLLRQALILAEVGFLSGFLQIVPAAATGTMHQYTARALIELSQGIAAMKIDPTVVSSEVGYTVSLETISNSFALSDRTRSWFATDTLVIRQRGAVARKGIPELEEARYLITAQLHGGWKCVFANNLFEAETWIRPYMFVCKSKQGSLGWLEAIP